ncbi:MAG: glutathione S-transferase family protein [Burkholderiales bacterium]|nr:glutathione S-transferase family protein [Burkholderiales bacterium]
MKLYGYRNGRTLRALWALEEVGAQYDYVEVDLLRGEGREPWFLEINPGGKVPVLDDGGTIITESAAVCMQLAERFPGSRLLPAPGTPERTDCYKWISFILTELDAPLWTIAKHRFSLPKERRVPAVIDTAIWEFDVAAKILAMGLAKHPFLVGDSFTVADILAGHTLLWAKSTRLELPDSLASYLNSLTMRDAFARARGRAQVSAALRG